MPIVNSLDDLQRLFQLVKEFRLDSVEVEGIKVEKRSHEMPAQPQTNPISNASIMDDPDLYYSS